MTGLTYEREALPMRTSSRREAAHGAASALEAKITKKRSRLAWGILVEALRNRSLVRASNGGSKMPRPGHLAPERARERSGSCDASSPAHPKACLLGCISAEASCMGVGDTGG